MKVLDTSAFKEYMREEVDNNGGVNEEVKERIISKLKVKTLILYPGNTIPCYYFMSVRRAMFWFYK